MQDGWQHVSARVVLHEGIEPRERDVRIASRLDDALQGRSYRRVAGCCAQEREAIDGALQLVPFGDSDPLRDGLAVPQPLERAVRERLDLELRWTFDVSFRLARRETDQNRDGDHDSVAEATHDVFLERVVLLRPHGAEAMLDAMRSFVKILPSRASRASVSVGPGDATKNRAPTSFRERPSSFNPDLAGRAAKRAYLTRSK